jgi:hypothetical protein
MGNFLDDLFPSEREAEFVGAVDLGGIGSECGKDPGVSEIRNGSGCDDRQSDAGDNEKLAK